MAIGQHDTAALTRFNTPIGVVHEHRRGAGVAQCQHAAVERTEHTGVAQVLHRHREKRVEPTNFQRAFVGGIYPHGRAGAGLHPQHMLRAIAQPAAGNCSRDLHRSVAATHAQRAVAFQRKVALEQQRQRLVEAAVDDQTDRAVVAQRAGSAMGREVQVDRQPLVVDAGQRIPACGGERVERAAAAPYATVEGRHRSDHLGQHASAELDRAGRHRQVDAVEAQRATARGEQALQRQVAGKCGRAWADCELGTRVGDERAAIDAIVAVQDESAPRAHRERAAVPVNGDVLQQHCAERARLDQAAVVEVAVCDLH